MSALCWCQLPGRRGSPKPPHTPLSPPGAISKASRVQGKRWPGLLAGAGPGSHTVWGDRTVGGSGLKKKREVWKSRCGEQGRRYGDDLAGS